MAARVSHGNLFFVLPFVRPALRIRSRLPTGVLLMKSSLRIPLTALALASLSVIAAGCKPAAKPADKATADAKTEAATAIPGLATEKEQVSYMIGLDLAKSFEPIKDEIDVDM